MDKALFSLVFFYYLYIVAILYYTFLRRKSALVNGEVSKSYFKNYMEGGTQELAILKNHFNNQFQLPIFFFITCVTAKIFQTIDGIVLGLAVAFVLSRISHSYIHLTSNKLIYRGLSYFIGIVVLVIMWIYILIMG